MSTSAWVGWVVGMILGALIIWRINSEASAGAHDCANRTVDDLDGRSR